VVLRLFVQKISETYKTTRAYLFLHSACSGGASIDVLRYLVEMHPQELNTVNVSGEPPLHVFLLRHKAMRKKTGSLDSPLAALTLLHHAGVKHILAVARLLVRHHKEPINLCGSRITMDVYLCTIPRSKMGGW
jgi:hypothetical protein